MGLLDDLIGSPAARDRNLSQDQAGVLVNGALEALAGGGEGGIDGPARRFQGAGLGDAIASWIGTGSNQAVEPSQLDRTLRGSPLEEIASRADLGGIAGAAALAALLPKLIDRLTPDGGVLQPDRLRETAAQARSSGGPASGTSKPRADFSKVTSSASSTAASPKPAEETYAVSSGDSLSTIAKKVYGDANQWKRIFEADRDQLSDPDLIRPDQVLRIPK